MISYRRALKHKKMHIKIKTHFIALTVPSGPSSPDCVMRTLCYVKHTDMPDYRYPGMYGAQPMEKYGRPQTPPDYSPYDGQRGFYAQRPGPVMPKIKSESPDGQSIINKPK